MKKIWISLGLRLVLFFSLSFLPSSLFSREIPEFEGHILDIPQLAKRSFWSIEADASILASTTQVNVFFGIFDTVGGSDKVCSTAEEFLNKARTKVLEDTSTLVFVFSQEENYACIRADDNLYQVLPDIWYSRVYHKGFFQHAEKGDYDLAVQETFTIIQDLFNNKKDEKLTEAKNTLHPKSVLTKVLGDFFISVSAPDWSQEPKEVFDILSRVVLGIMAFMTLIFLWKSGAVSEFFFWFLSPVYAISFLCIFGNFGVLVFGSYIALMFLLRRVKNLMKLALQEKTQNAANPASRPLARPESTTPSPSLASEDNRFFSEDEYKDRF